MATEVETLVVKLEGRITDFEKAMGRALSSAQATGRKINSTFVGMNRGLSTVFRGAGALVGITALASIPKVIKDIVDEASHLVDTADKLGITTKQLQELKFAAGQTSVEFSDLTSGLSFFAKQVGEAGRGQGELLNILKANNVPLRDANGNVRSLIDLFRDYADLVANAADQTAKATLVTKALGKSSDELIVTLDGGSAGLATFAEQADKTGQILEDGLLRKTEALGDKWDQLMGSLTTGFQTFVLSIVTGVADANTELAKLLDAPAKAAANPDRAAQIDAERRADDEAQNQALRLEVIAGWQQQITDLEQRRADLEKEIADRVAAGGSPEIIDALRASLGDANDDLETLNRNLQRLLDLQARAAAGLPLAHDGETPAAGAPPAAGFVPPIPRIRPRKTVVPGSPGSGGPDPQDAIDRVTDSLKFEAEQLTRTAREQEIYNSLNQAGVTINSAAGAAIAAQAGANFDLKNSIEENTAAMEEFHSVASEALRGFITDVEGGVAPLDALANAVQRLLDKALDKGIDQLLSTLVSGGLGGGGFIGGLASAIGRLFGGFRAEGGPVTAGKAFIVGEKGRPEVFVPNVSGRIVPTGGGAGEGRHVIELVLTPEVDARIKRVAGPQSQQISVAVTRANNAINQRQQELRG